MLRTKSRDSVWHQPVRCREQRIHKVLVPTEIAVKNPSTGEDEFSVINTYKEENLIDSHLRASDFSLEITMRNPDMMRDCGKYFEPSTPEEYVDTVAKLSRHYEEEMSRVYKPESALGTAPEPAPNAE